MYQPRREARSTFVPIRQHRYHLRLWGEPSPAQPPLVLLHGWMDVSASWQFVVDALEQDRFIVAPDWRGFGLTEGPVVDHYFFPDYLADLDFLLDHFAGDAPVDLVGHSMGGNVSMLYCGVRPERIRRLVNLEGFGMPASRPSQAPGRYARWMDELKELHRGEKTLQTYASAEGVAQRLMKTNRRLPQDQAEWLARHWAREGDDGRWHILGDAAHKVVGAQLYRVDEALECARRITAPVLWVEAGDDSLDKWWQGKFTLAEFHERLKLVPVLEKARVEDAGHMLHHDQPTRVAHLIETFFAKST
ncbi:alpha/beta fold hydrolase [Ramlibacter rhizophilus]|uniref:Alpha/beta hydrolase n=1 Tax=Ramlibacter rhizophilus TaxID=1781167 RepID=A0A4Z0BNV3_9BURK|nr:alpha/beta hydrolase [Ramlibacter rhizophilus]TFY99947.1 alpha/beta hydrolase [Ramlibacter rhizophilus]